MPAPADIAAQVTRRRHAVATAWGDAEAVVVIGSGTPLSIPGRGDLVYPFRAHSEYLYLTDRDAPGGVLAFDPQDGWVDFAAPITEADRLWSGAPDSDPSGPSTEELADWLRRRSGRPLAELGAAVPGVHADSALSAELRFALDGVRRVKDVVELARMRAAERATSAAFAVARATLAPGVTERAVQIELEAAALRHGGDRMAYDTIVGGGPNAAVLHFAPTVRPLGAGELVLIDAGAEVDGYASDITRTYPVSGELDPLQDELYAVVLAAQRAAIDLCHVGAEWRDVHRAAALVIADGLTEVGLLRGRPDSLLESGAVWLFFPHGVGHLVGLGVRDAGGPLAERRDRPPPFPNLRIDLPLAPGYVVTVEPGVYFVPAILRDPERRRRHADEVAWDRVDALLGFGGIRIEDNVLITDDGHEILTADVPHLD